MTSSELTHLSAALRRFEGKLDDHSNATSERFGQMRHEMLQRFDHMGDAFAELRSDVRAHIEVSDLKHLGHVERDERIRSDVRELRGDVATVEDTSRQWAVTAARADVLVERGTKDVDEIRNSRAIILRMLLSALLGAAMAVGAQLLLRYL